MPAVQGEVGALRNAVRNGWETRPGYARGEREAIAQQAARCWLDVAGTGGNGCGYDKRLKESSHEQAPF
jgi:hypothetical protein